MRTLGTVLQAPHRCTHPRMSENQTMTILLAMNDSTNRSPQKPKTPLMDFDYAGDV